MSVVCGICAFCHVSIRAFVRREFCILGCTIDILYAVLPVSRNVTERYRIYAQNIIEGTLVGMQHRIGNTVTSLRNHTTEQQRHGTLCKNHVGTPPVAPVGIICSKAVIIQDALSPRLKLTENGFYLV